MKTYRNRLILGLVVAFILYAALGIFAGTQDVFPHLARFPWVLLLPVMLLKMGAWFLRFWRWQYFLGVIDAARHITLFDSAVLFVTGFVMVISPGKLGEVLKAVILKMKTGVPVARSAPVVFAERVVDAIAVLIMALLAFWLAGAAIPLADYRGLMLGATVLLVIGLVGVQIRPLAHWVLGLLGKLPFVGRFEAPLTLFYDSSRSILHVKPVILTTLLGTLAHTLDSLSFCIIVSGFGLPITLELFWQAMFITALTALVGGLSGVPNGAGITEGASSGMILAIITPLHPIIMPPVALAIALIEGFFHKWFRVLVGLIVAIVFRKRLFVGDFEQVLVEEEKGEQR